MAEGAVGRRLRQWLFRVAYGAVFVFLLGPIVVVVGTSVIPSGEFVFPPSGVSLRWYAAFATSETWLTAATNSAVAATGTTLLSTTLGTLAALGVRGLDGRREAVVVVLAVAPLFVPGVVMGVTLLLFLSQFDLQQSRLAVVLAHSLWATPLTFAVVRAALSRFDWRVRDAALDLGASRPRAFLEVVAPNVRAGLVAAALVAAVVSLQEFIMTLFVAGPDTRTVPVEAWNTLRSSVDPLVSVVATLLVVAVLVGVGLAAAATGLDRLARDT
jgi:ABC-type spermidine/putrescine transport system permease subunit II